MNVPLGTRKLLVARGMVVILGSVGAVACRLRDGVAPVGGRRAGRPGATDRRYLPSEKTKRAAKTRLMK